jgi:hypothetical protein
MFFPFYLGVLHAMFTLLSALSGGLARVSYVAVGLNLQLKA